MNDNLYFITGGKKTQIFFLWIASTRVFLIYNLSFSCNSRDTMRIIDNKYKIQLDIIVRAM